MAVRWVLIETPNRSGVMAAWVCRLTASTVFASARTYLSVLTCACAKSPLDSMTASA